MGTSNSHHFRKLVAGACMVAAPVLFLAAAIVSPRLDASGGVQLAIVGENADRWLAAQVIGLLGLVLVVPAVLGLMHMLRERQVAAGHLGGALTLVGTLAAIAATGIGFVLWQMARPGLDPVAMTALAERMTDSAAIVWIVFVPTFLFAVGMIVLAGGLMRARVVHPFLALLLAVGAVGLVLAYGPLASITLATIASVVFLVGLVPVGWTVLMESDEDWEHPPEFRGFRPAAGMR